MSTATTVRIPTQLRSLTGGLGEVAVDATTVGQALKALESAHPGFAERILDEDGNVRRFVNVFAGDENIRFLRGLDTAIEGDQTISIVPAVAGG